MSEAIQRVGLSQTEDRTLFSRLVGMEYHLQIRLPEQYASSNQRYPVIYVLDGDVNFGLATTLIWSMALSRRIPEMIVVGIGYDRPIADFWLLRELDFKIPEVQAEPPDSHADRFMAALKDELIPFVEANYRTDPGERTLFGYSSSGFFTLYALVHEPGLFRHYLAGSPDLDLSCPYLLAHDQRLAGRDPSHPIDLFFTVGGLEVGTFQSSLEKFNELAAAMQARSYPGIWVMTETYPGENHGEVGLALTFIHGLRQCFSTDS